MRSDGLDSGSTAARTLSLDDRIKAILASPTPRSSTAAQQGGKREKDAESSRTHGVVKESKADATDDFAALMGEGAHDDDNLSGFSDLSDLDDISLPGL